MQSKRNNIIFLVPGFPKDETDTTCIPILQNYIFYYNKYNPDYNIAVIAFQYPFKKGIYKWNGVDVYAAGGKNRKSLFKLLTWIRVVFFFLRIHFNNQTTVIHSFWLNECAFIGQLINWMFKTNHISTIVGQDCLASNKYLSLLNFSKIKVTALSSFAADKFYQSTNRKVAKVISIGIDSENFTSPLSDRPSIDIIGVGNLHAIKNFRLFIEVIEGLKVEFPGIRCKIIGNGGEYPLLAELIKDFQLENNIELTGELPRKKVLEIMADSSILLHTSTHEGQGYVFEEALYSGMSVVAFRVGNLQQGPKVSLCTDSFEMKEALRHFLLNPPVRERLILNSMLKSIEEYNKLYFPSYQ